MLHDGNKLKGRFIKHNARLMKVVKLEAFDFHQLHADFTIYPDNPAGNIVHSRLHDPKVVEKNTALPPNVFPSLAEDHAPPTMKPRDFNNDWKEARQKALHKKGLSQEEEEDFDNELEEHFARMDQKRHQPNGTRETKNIENEKSEFNQEENQRDQNKVPEQSGNLNVLEETQDSANPLSIHPENEIQNDPLSDLKEKRDTFHIDDSSEPNIAQDLKPTDSELENQKNLEIEHKEHLDNLEELKNQAIQEGQKSGFDQGYEEGLKQAADEHKVKTETNLQNMQEALREIQALKPQIMNKIQDNFQELTAAICEGVLGHALAESPRIFSEVIQKAITDGVKDDNYHVHVHENMFEKLKGIVSEDFLSHLKVDASVEGEDFKIVTEWGDIEGAISRKVRDFLEQADTRLFDIGEEDADPTV